MAIILVVDDEVGIRELLSEILIDEGFDVRLAENATAARRIRGELRPDLVQKYQSEGKAPVLMRDRAALQAKGIKVIERDFTSETDYIRHDPRKLARTVEDFASGWIK